MLLSSFWISCIVGVLCGIISGFGIGGGSLLMVWMTAALSMDLRTAQAINLMYFVPTSITALYSHIKNKMICWHIVIPAVIAGCITGALSSLCAGNIDITILKKLFGGYLCIIGIKELLYKEAKK